MGSLCFSSRVIGNTITVHTIYFWNKMKFTHEIQGVDKRFGRKYVNISARTSLNKKKMGTIHLFNLSLNPQA